MHRITFMLLCGALALLAACSPAGTGDSSKGTTDSAAQKASATASSNAAGAGAAAAAGGQKGAASEIVRAASAKEVQVKAGGQAEAEVRLDIMEGYHVNANPPTDKNLIGTTLSVAGGEGLTAGAPLYPRAIMKKLEFDERPLAVYEREAIIKLPLRAAASAARGPQTLQAKVRVQPCNDKECLPPRTIETTIPVTVN